MKFPCLVLDHDDTVVNSTATIHYPAFIEYMKIKRPALRMTLEEYFALNFDPGVVSLFRDICGLSEEEMREEEQFWRNYVKNHIPDVYEGMRDILWACRRAGVRLCVVSHSYSDYIYRDYAHGKLPEPDLVFGWELEPEKRKPDPFALYEIQRIYGFSTKEMLVLDDLKPGYDMAGAAGAVFAAAGWANNIEAIESFMHKNCDHYFKRIQDLWTFLKE